MERVIEGKEYKVSATEFGALLKHQQRYELREQWFKLAGLALPYLVPVLLVIFGAVLALRGQPGLAAYALLSVGGVTGTGLAVLAKVKGAPPATPRPPSHGPTRAA